ncbi:MAG: hypothetical protein ACPGLV_00915 [Bacteroidia bacterium]
MKNFLLVVALLTGNLLPLMAQNHLLKSLDKGVEAHRQYSLVQCDSILARVLTRQSELGTMQLGMATYFYNRNLIRLAVEEGESKNGFTKFSVQHKLFSAYKNLLALEKKQIPRWSEKARPEIKNMYKSLLTGAVQCLEVYVQNQGDKTQLQFLIDGYTDLAVTIVPESYTAVELKGQLAYLKGEQELAIAYYKDAIEKYKAKRVLMADNIRIPSVYHSLALNAMKTSWSEAYKLAQNGFAINELEWNTIKANASQLGETVVEDNKAVYFNNLYNLGLLELETAMIVVTNSDSLIELYKQRVMYYEDVFSIQLNYGNLLRDVNPREASIHYQKAIDIEPKSYDAHFAIATLYFDLGFYYLDEATRNRGQKKELTNKAHQLIGVGIGNMETAHELNLKASLPIKWLIKGYREVGQKSEVQYYQQKLDEL